MKLQQTIDHTTCFFGSMFDIHEVLERVNPVNHGHKVDIIFQLLGLHVADKVPLNVFWQCCMLVTKFGGVVLAKDPLACIVCLTEVFDGLGLGNSHKPYAFAQCSLDVREIF